MSRKELCGRLGAVRRVSIARPREGGRRRQGGGGIGGGGGGGIGGGGGGGLCFGQRTLASLSGLGLTLRVAAPVLCALVLQRHFQHADLPLQLVVDLLAVTPFALELCNLGLHLGALNVPGIAGPFVVVPFDLEEAHHPCVVHGCQHAKFPRQ